MSAQTATVFSPVTIRPMPMPKTRKRFYVVRDNQNGLQIVSLRHLMTDICYTHQTIIGPFRTFNDAVARLEREAGVVSPSGY